MTISIASGFPVSSTSSPAITTVAAGDLIVVMVGTQSAAAPTSISDTNSRITWNGSAAVNYIDSSHSSDQSIWYGIVKASGGIGATTVTVNGGTPNDITVYELTDSNPGATWSVVQALSSNVASGTTITWPNLTSSSGADQAYLGYCSIQNSWTGTSFSGFTGFTTAQTNGCISNLALAASTGYQPTGTQNSSGYSDTVGAIFLATPAGTPSTSGPNYAGAASGMSGGTGTWANLTNADGSADGLFATWTVM